MCKSVEKQALSYITSQVQSLRLFEKQFSSSDQNLKKKKKEKKYISLNPIICFEDFILEKCAQRIICYIIIITLKQSNISLMVGIYGIHAYNKISQSYEVQIYSET